MASRFGFRATLNCSYAAYIVQASVNNIAPILYIVMMREFSLSLGQIAFLMSFNFVVQICVDAFGAAYADRIGYRPCTVAAHFFAFSGLLGLGLFPYVFPDPFAGILLATVFYAIGGGLIEVLVSPIVEALPSEQKSGAMSILHSFYCWGQLATVLISTLLLVTLGDKYWFVIPALWSLLPFFNAFLFMRVPIRHLSETHERTSVGKLFGMKVFWMMMVLMLCAGASELSMSQWASLFAELGLNVSKTVGDLLGPSMFALLMGISRVFYGKFCERIDLRRYILGSAVLCVISYLVCVFAPWPIVSLLGCAFCGLSVGIMWPGTLSLAAERCPAGNTAIFAILALCGDCGCSLGPALVGTVSAGVTGKFLSFTGEAAGLHAGLLSVVLFPAIMVVFAILLRKQKSKS